MHINTCMNTIYIQIYKYSPFYTSKKRILPLYLVFSQSELYYKRSLIMALSNFKASDDGFSLPPNKIQIPSLEDPSYSGPKL